MAKVKRPTLRKEVLSFIKRRAFCYEMSLFLKFGRDGLRARQIANELVKTGHVVMLGHRAQMNLRNAGKLAHFRRTGASVYVSQV
jgi:hypothetical protein